MNPKPFDKPIYVTRPFLPPLEAFRAGLQEIWDNAWLTNNGPILQRYERALCQHFGTNNLCLFNNGTLALQIALQGMGISGEVITTPFTFVATTHALFWNKVRPVFVDIEPDYYTIDPAKVEQAITPWTTAILAVHVYGYPCRHAELADIARRHNLRLIYDAAHAFDVKINGQSIASLGDLSMFSFHSTKHYHSVEGGMLVFADPGLKKTFDYLKNFGFDGETEVVMPGTNAKMNELQALMGLQVLDYLPTLIAKRRRISELYRLRLDGIPGIVLPPAPGSELHYTYAYFPIEVDEAEFGMSRDALYNRLKEYNIYSRRYFYPLLTDFACYRHVSVQDPLLVARRIASRILTLPIFDALSTDAVERICAAIEYLHRSSKRGQSAARSVSSDSLRQQALIGGTSAP